MRLRTLWLRFQVAPRVRLYAGDDLRTNHSTSCDLSPGHTAGGMTGHAPRELQARLRRPLLRFQLVPRARSFAADDLA